MKIRNIDRMDPRIREDDMTLSILFRSLIVKSLILAQDERWRRG